MSMVPTNEAPSRTKEAKREHALPDFYFNNYILVFCLEARASEVTSMPIYSPSSLELRASIIDSVHRRRLSLSLVDATRLYIYIYTLNKLRLRHAEQGKGLSKDGRERGRLAS